MKNLQLGACLVALLLAACGRQHDEPAQAGHEHGHEHEEDTPRGPHGGRLLEQDGMEVELAIAEEGTPPKFQAWLRRDGKSLPPAAGTVEVRLTRLGDVKETHLLLPREDGSLRADTVVGEPHSFDLEVLATIDSKPLRWAYESHEGRTHINAAMAEESGIRVTPAGPGVIADEHEVQGLLTPIEGRVASVTARFPGPVLALHAEVGDTVRAGQVLASVESNLSLSAYDITAPIAGTVLARNASVGALAGEGAPLYEIADLSSLWVDLHIFGADAQHIRAGVPVEVTRLADGASITTRLERVLPGTATASQSTIARATIANRDAMWRPGSAVRARITVDREPVELAVPLSALQTFRDWDVVFIQVGEDYEVRPVELGKRDARQVQVLSGLVPGDLVVVEQSYLVKADIEKSGASHEH
ncbi:MAG TPA: efflux RND transporter periplasmic adaptor subunit [Steroidobacteraceae bacterium]|nr:efflux RND transporter periplasmic adaptor subunit [Steroidobacteraceae bacterium]